MIARLWSRAIVIVVDAAVTLVEAAPKHALTSEVSSAVRYLSMVVDRPGTIRPQSEAQAPRTSRTENGGRCPCGEEE